jgi:hypothetical protein
LSDGEIRIDSAEIWASVRKELAPQVKAPDVDFDKYEVRIVFIDKANPNWIEIGFSAGPNPIIGGSGWSTCLGYRRTDSSVFVCFLIDKRGLSNAQSIKQKP